MNIPANNSVRMWVRTALRNSLGLGRAPGYFLFLPLFALIGFGGCPSKHPQPRFSRTGVIVPPNSQPHNIDTTPPDIAFESNPDKLAQWPVTVFMIPAPRPPAPRKTTIAPEPEPEPVKQEAPLISPQLSPDEKIKAQASTDGDVRVAQQNLDSAAGRRLDAKQQDLADKIRSFLKQAQEAITAADWTRASSLAHKARLLSVELVQSF